MGDRPEAGPALGVRPALPADHPFVVDVGEDAFARFGEYRPILREFLASPVVRCFIAESSGDRAGFAMVGSIPEHPGVFDLVAIAVGPRYRRTGVGRVLLAHVIAVCEAPGASTLIVLTVADDNDAAIALFQLLGFAMVPGSSGRYSGGQISRRMIRAAS